MPLNVFLHGVGETPQVWQDQVVALPPGAKAVAPWLRGLRPGRDEDFSVHGAADDVLALLNTYGVEQMTLIGSGVGAMVALDAAVRDPGTISHLVLSGCQLAPSKSTLRAQRMALSLTPAKRLARMGIDKEKLRAALDALDGVDPTDRLDAVTARTLVVVGAADAAGHPTAAKLAAAITDARLEIIPGARQAPHSEEPAAFNDKVFGFLAE